MIAVDTNILIYAHREEMEWHSVAAARLTSLVGGNGPWALPWPCVHEFLAKVTHRRIFPVPTPPAIAMSFVEKLVATPGARLLAEGDGYLEVLGRMVTEARASGALIHDARIAALCVSHGVSELWTADRDFGRFPALKVRNPLVSSNEE